MFIFEQAELKKLQEAVREMMEKSETELRFIEAKKWRLLLAKLEIMIRSFDGERK